MPDSKKRTYQYSKGALLFEMLIVISLIAIILSFSANAIFLSIKSNKTAGDRDTANLLATESLEAVRSISEEDWQNLYTTTKATAHYYPAQSGNKWILSSGDETININNVTYTRYILVDSVSRDATTRDIENTYVSVNDDPSTQKVTVIVSSTNGGTASISEFLYRWKNKVCGQSGWVTGGTGNTIKACTDTSYDTKDAAVDVSGGTIKLQ